MSKHVKTRCAEMKLFLFNFFDLLRFLLATHIQRCCDFDALYLGIEYIIVSFYEPVAKNGSRVVGLVEELWENRTT